MSNFSNISATGVEHTGVCAVETNWEDSGERSGALIGSSSHALEEEGKLLGDSAPASNWEGSEGFGVTFIGSDCTSGQDTL